MRLIDADALLENQTLMNLTRCNGKTLLNEVIKEITRIIKEAPTIEQKQGEWIVGKCSICNSPIPTDYALDYLSENDNIYCYNCGAKMESEEE